MKITLYRSYKQSRPMMKFRAPINPRYPGTMTTSTRTTSYATNRSNIVKAGTKSPLWYDNARKSILLKCYDQTQTQTHLFFP